MSRIWKLPVAIPEKVEASVKDNAVTVKGPLGQLTFAHSDKVKVEVKDGNIVTTPVKPEYSAMWGTTRAVLNNMVEWVVNGYKKSLEINGVWYKFEVQGTKLILSIGYSHKVEMQAPEWVKVEMDEKLKNVIHISGIHKQDVGQFASKIKAKKKPEPYKGKGIKYLGEHIKRKAGKTGA